MKEKVKNKIPKILIFMLGVLFLWMLLVIIFSMRVPKGLLSVVKDDTCEKIKIGETESGRDVYSYCLKEVNLDKVLRKNGKISDSLLIKDLKKKDCLYDGGTCSYVAKEYKIISCRRYEGSNDFVITTKEKDIQEMYDQFCREEMLK